MSMTLAPSAGPVVAVSSIRTLLALNAVLIFTLLWYGVNPLGVNGVRRLNVSLHLRLVRRRR